MKEDLFREWICQNPVDPVTRIVFSGLVRKYDRGSRGWIFRKLICLEEAECYVLAAKLFSLIQFLGIDKEYKKFRAEFF